MTETYQFTTPWGSTVSVVGRKNKNDYNTLCSCIQHDEYHIQQIGAKRDDVFIDIGAHVGGATIAAANFGMKTVSVEIFPENVKLITENLALSGLSPDDRIVAKAIHHTAGQQINMIYGDTTTESGLHHQFIGSTTDTVPTNVARNRVQAVTTTSLVELFAKIDRCRILKIDCEGAEWQCFKNVPDSIFDRIDYIVGELHMVPDAKTNNPLDFLKLFRNKFDDVSTEFKEIGFKTAAENNTGIFNFVLRHK